MGIVKYWEMDGTLRWCYESGSGMCCKSNLYGTINSLREFVIAAEVVGRNCNGVTCCSISYRNVLLHLCIGSYTISVMNIDNLSICGFFFRLYFSKIVGFWITHTSLKSRTVFGLKCSRVTFSRLPLLCSVKSYSWEKKLVMWQFNPWIECNKQV